MHCVASVEGVYLAVIICWKVSYLHHIFRLVPADGTDATYKLWVECNKKFWVFYCCFCMDICTGKSRAEGKKELIN